jgi:tetratricopeptide (TPR) repeat protein
VGSRRGYDWRNWRNDYYAGRSWYRGNWNGGWYGRWDNRWQRSWRGYPAAVSFGLTPWGVNRMGYWFGYQDYYNPYYYQPLVVGSTTIDYSQPLVAIPAENESSTTIADFDRARDAFKQERYKESLTLVNRALAEHQRDATLHEFRALVLFAMADYREAAQTLNPVLAVGPGWDWPTLRGLYSGVSEYTKHLRALESYVGDHKDKGYAHFLLGYHYLTAGHEDAARKQFQRTVALAPKDEVSRQLLSMLDKDGKIDAPAMTRTDADAKIAVDDLVGTWNAKRENGEFSLRLEKDMRFTWTHREGKRTSKVTGVFAVNNGTLALEPQAGGVMLANIQMKAKGRMQFRMVGSGAKDNGLTFTR